MISPILTIEVKRSKAIKSMKEFINCLRNERIIIRHIPRQSNMVQNPKHVLYGGMADTAIRVFVVPKLSSGKYVNVLTDDEKDFLEDVMGLEPNSLSIYKRDNNFWDDSNVDGVSKVMLKKQDNYLDLSNPEDYIKYKILLANKDYIAPSLQDLEDYPKATYQFVIIEEGDETRSAKSNMSNTMMCYKEYGKIEDDKDTLSLIIETLDGRPVATSSKLEFLQTKINDLIQANPKTFLQVITDKLLPTKVLIRKAISHGIISKRGNFLYLRSDGKPLCNDNEDPTINVAARYLNNPKYQGVKFAIEAELNAGDEDSITETLPARKTKATKSTESTDKATGE